VLVTRVLLVGLPGAGKTTLSRRLAERLGLPVLRVDDHRRLIGDGTVASEYRARGGFLEACATTTDAIIETAGLGAHRVALRHALESVLGPVCIATVWCDEASRVERLLARRVGVPQPDWGLPPTWEADKQAARLRDDFASGFWCVRPDWHHVEVRGDQDLRLGEATILELVGDVSREEPTRRQRSIAGALAIGWRAVVPTDLRSPSQARRPTDEEGYALVSPECDERALLQLTDSLRADGTRVMVAPSGPRMWTVIALRADAERVAIDLAIRRPFSAAAWMSRFVERMERAAVSRGASDAWACFAETTAALDALLRGWCAARSGTPVGWSDATPDARATLAPHLRKSFRYVAPGLDLARSHADAGRLLDFADELGRELRDTDAAAILSDWIPFLRWATFVRDGLWNFRDAARYADGVLRPGTLFRGSSPTRYADEAGSKLLERWLDATRIAIAIDLRTEIEDSRSSYASPWRERLERRHVAFSGRAADVEDARGDAPLDYVRMFERNRRQIVDALAAVATASEPVLIHCHAGMDRTGVVMSVIGYLCSVPRRGLLMDYLASGGTTAVSRIEGLVDHLEAMGGPPEVAARLELPDDVLARLRSRLRSEAG
jgi:hypothetical protein